MTFRDDHDAALARADALEGEVERTKRERDELAAKVEQLEAAASQDRAERDKRARRDERDEPERASADTETRNERRFAFGAAAATAVVFGVIALFGIRRGCEHEREVAAWQAKHDAREAHQKRWAAVVSIEPCLHRIAHASQMARTATPDKIDPRTTSNYYRASPAVGNCLGGATTLLADPATSPPVKRTLGAWLDLQRALEAPAKAVDDYYSNRDWQEDGFAGAPALWKPVLAILDRQNQMFDQVRRDVVPALRDEMRAVIAAHEQASGRDEIYWRAALTLHLYDITDRAYAAAGVYAGKPWDYEPAVAAVAADTAKFLELAKQAPIEVRRDLRRIDWITGQLVTGGALIGETPLWHLQNDEDVLLRGRGVVPALPPDPGKRPEDLSD